MMPMTIEELKLWKNSDVCCMCDEKIDEKMKIL